MMNSRERQLAAIRHEVPDRVPVDAIAIEIQEQLAALLGVEQRDVLSRLGIDGRIVAAPFKGEVRAADSDVAYTEWGTPNTGDYGTARFYPLRDVSSITEIEHYAWPNAAQYDYGWAANAARELAQEYAVRGPYWKPLFCRVCDLIGMEQAMLCMSATPRLFEAALARVFDYTYDYCARLLDACGEAMPIFCLGDDFATQRGMMISPAQWRRYLKPAYARLFALAKDKGKYVWFHSCGDITAVLPDLIDIGLDVWETVQLHTLPLSPRQLKREYGQFITFFGGINTQRLPFISPEQVRAEVRSCIEVLGRGGGYICGPDHHIKPDVPPHNAIALFEAATAFRAAGYTTSGDEG